MLAVLDAGALLRWCALARADLAAAREEIDALNVYPVPDGDTGTNLLLTFEAVEAAVRGAVPSGAGGLAEAAQALARGALMGARGNSGVILSQLLRGLTEQWADGSGDAASLVTGLASGAALAEAAVSAPVEGTVLTVARDSAAAAAATARGEVSPSLSGVARSAVRAAEQSLARTTGLLPALAAAGVVDAGARGWCVVLRALEKVVAEDADPRDGPRDGGAEPARHDPPPPPPLVPREGGAAERETGSDAFDYEVQYLLRDSSDQAVAALRAQLEALGDSVAVVGAGGIYNVHVHVDDVGAAVEAGLDAGRPFRIGVTRFGDQTAGSHAPAAPVATRCVVAVAPGEGIAALFAAAGARAVPHNGTTPPEAAALLAAVLATGASEVVLLPNGSAVLPPAAEAAAAARERGLLVAVLPTRAVPQGLAAVAVADPTRPFADDVASMADAAGSTRWGEVLIASQTAATSQGVCRPGDVLGLADGDVVILGSNAEQVAGQLLSRMTRGGAELVTLLIGAGTEPGLPERLAAQLTGIDPSLEVEVHDGGQGSPVLLGVE